MKIMEIIRSFRALRFPYATGGSQKALTPG